MAAAWPAAPGCMGSLHAIWSKAEDGRPCGGSQRSPPAGSGEDRAGFGSAREDQDPLMWPVASETEALLRRVAQADALAADELWELHRPALRRLVDLRMGQAL